MKEQILMIGEIESILARLKLSLKNEPSFSQISKGKRTNTDRSGVASTLRSLTSEGFFDSAKTLSDIQQKLRDEGITKPTTSLMGPILRLIRNKQLARSMGKNGQYQYFARRSE